MPAPRSELILVRHGETTGQSSIRLYGATDVPLSPVGEAQARAAGDALAHESFDRVISSPLCRAWRSAELVAAALEGHASVEVERVEGLREIDFGAWEGWTVDEVRERAPDLHGSWMRDGDTFTFPDGERRGAFRERIRQAVRAAIAAPCEAASIRMLGVLHKGVIKIIVSELTGMPREEAATLTVNLGSIHRLEYASGAWRIASLNQTQHLAGDLHFAHS